MHFPKSGRIPAHLGEALERVFIPNAEKIDSYKFQINSNEVLDILASDFHECGYVVETGKSAEQKISIPVLFGLNGKREKSFDADAFHISTGTVVEIEAGRAVVNYQFLKDFFEACVMTDASHLIIAVRNDYRGTSDFMKVVQFFETLYSSGRLWIPLKSLLVIGY